MGTDVLMNLILKKILSLPELLLHVFVGTLKSEGSFIKSLLTGGSIRNDFQ